MDRVLFTVFGLINVAGLVVIVAGTVAFLNGSCR